MTYVTLLLRDYNFQVCATPLQKIKKINQTQVQPSVGEKQKVLNIL